MTTTARTLIEQTLDRLARDLPTAPVDRARRALGGLIAPADPLPIQALPAYLVGDAAERTPRTLRDAAARAHLLALLAMSAPDPALSAARDAHFAPLAAAGAPGFAQAEQEAADALAEAAAGPRSWPEYRMLTRAALAPAFPAALGLAMVSGWPRSAIRRVEATVEGVMLGLRYRHDAAAPHGGPAVPGEPRHRVVTGLLRLSAGAFDQAARAAAALGAAPLARWSDTEARRSRARVERAGARPPDDLRRRRPGRAARLAPARRPA